MRSTALWRRLRKGERLGEEEAEDSGVGMRRGLDVVRGFVSEIAGTSNTFIRNGLTVTLLGSAVLKRLHEARNDLLAGSPRGSMS